MRPSRRAILTATMASFAAPAVLRQSFADAPRFTLKLHHPFSSLSSAHDQFLAPWARQVETQSGGRIRIDIFPAMQLGGSPAQLFDQARDGVADIVWAAPRQTPGRFPKIELFELPFVPSRRALVSSKAIEQYARDHLSDEFREVHPICFSCSDRGVVHTNRPIHTVEDIRGLRLHVQTRSAAAAMRALGALAVPMRSQQLPLAITRHVVDGCVDPWDMVPALKLSDLLKDHTEFAESSLSTTTLVLAMNKAAYDRLPRDLKTVLDNNSGQVAAGMAGAMWDLKAAAVADLVSQRGNPIVTLLPEAVGHWRNATRPVIEAWLKDMKQRKIDGDKLIASARDALAKYANEPEPQPPPPPKPVQSAPPAEAKAETAPPVKANGRAAAPAAAVPNSAASPAPQVSVATPAPTSAPATAPAPAHPAPWWQFWKSAPAPATVSEAPVVPPVPPVPPALHVPVAPSTVPAAPPVVPPTATIVPSVPAPAPLKTLDIPL